MGTYPSSPEENAGGAHDDEYRLARQDSAPAVPARGPMWFLAKRGGQQTGPFPTDEVLSLLRSGKASPTDMAWREGMPAWVPVQRIPEFAVAPSAAAAPASSPGVQPATATAAPKTAAPKVGAAATSYSSSAKAWGSLPQSDVNASDVERFLRSPRFFRWFGRGAGILGVLGFFGSVVAMIFHLSWFQESLILVALFFAGEAVGSLLERLDLLASQR